MKKIQLILLAFLIAISSAVFAHSQGEAQKAIAAAEAAYKKVADVKYAWRDTAKMIKKAKQALKAKDYKSAVSIAKKAEKQGQNALAQYQFQMVKRTKFGID